MLFQSYCVIQFSYDFTAPFVNMWSCITMKEIRVFNIDISVFFHIDLGKFFEEK